MFPKIIFMPYVHGHIKKYLYFLLHVRRPNTPLTLRKKRLVCTVETARVWLAGGVEKPADAAAAAEPAPAPETSTPSVSLETPEGYYELVGERKIAEYLTGLPK